MTGLLVSVRDAAEARVAVEAGVDLVDVKEPFRGALGPADAATIRHVVATVERYSVNRSVPISIALGELPKFPAETVRPQFEGIRFAKIGLAGCAEYHDWPRRWAAAIDHLPDSVGRVAVIYADWQAARSPHPDEILDAARQLNCVAALVDTFDKRRGALVEHWSLGQIEQFIGCVRDLGMLAVVGGGLTQASAAIIVPLSPDFVAVRGAACAGQRSDAIDRQRVEQLASLVRRGAVLSSPH